MNQYNNIGCIYLITCLMNGKRYVGLSKYPTPDNRYEEHWRDMKHGFSCDHESDEYKAVLRRPLYTAMHFYGPNLFRVELLCTSSHEGLPNMEAYWAEQLETYAWDSPGGYNAVWCGKGWRLGIPDTEETRIKKSNSHKAMTISDEHRAKMIDGLRKPETRAAMSAIGRARKATPEACQNISNALKGHTVSDVTRQKISDATRAGMTDERRNKLSKREITSEWCAKISAAAKARGGPSRDAIEKARKKKIGQKRSPSQKARMSAAAKLAHQKRKEALTPAPAAPPSTP